MRRRFPGSLSPIRLLVLAALPLLPTPIPLLIAATDELTCGAGSFRLSTGSDSGDCIVEKGVRAICLDPASNSVYARCEAGCLSTNGTASCSLSDEDPIGGSFVLICRDGPRYLLRTRTGRGLCRADPATAGGTARCSDTKENSVEASCAKGCVATRGKALCAKYKATTEAP